MSKPTQSKPLLPLGGLLTFILVLGGLIACETPQQAGNVNNLAAQGTSAPLTNTPIAAATATELAFRARVLAMPPQVLAHETVNPTVQAAENATVKNYADMLT